MSQNHSALSAADENRVVWLVVAVQFVHLVDFVMVMPLGPDFSRTINMDASAIGTVGGIFTLAAAVSALCVYRFLDHFNRKRSLLVAVVALAVATAATGLAWNYHSLLLFRALAGMAAGPVTALALASLTDGVAPQRRGRAFGLVAAAFSAAAVIGVPLGLELARLFSWPMAFVAVGAATLLVAACIFVYMPELGQASGQPALSLKEVARSRRHQLGLGVMFIAVFSIFLLIPQLSGYWQFNRGFPREHLSLLYMAGGVAAFVLSRVAGKLVDSHGAMLPVGLFATGLIVITFLAFTLELAIPVAIVFIAYMGFAAARSVPSQTLSSLVPPPHQRAGYMALQSATQSLGAGVASVISSIMVRELPDHSLVNIPVVSLLSIASLVLLIWLCSRLNAEVANESMPARAG